jgi:putative membrane protein
MSNTSISLNTLRISVAVAALAAVSACTKKETPAADTTATVTAAPAPAPAPAAPAINDAQIAHIVVTANAIDSTAGALAKTKGSSKDVKDFAQTMVKDHMGVNKQAVALATKLNVTPEANDVSKQLMAGADENVANLKGLSGAAFDKAYIDHEVAYHQAVLDALDKTLVPSAQNAELKDLLVKVRPAFVAHLDRAKSIQTSLTK